MQKNIGQVVEKNRNKIKGTLNDEGFIIGQFQFIEFYKPSCKPYSLKT
jgi:hypothetical protein